MAINKTTQCVNDMIQEAIAKLNHDGKVELARGLRIEHWQSKRVYVLLTSKDEVLHQMHAEYGPDYIVIHAYRMYINTIDDNELEQDI